MKNKILLLLLATLACACSDEIYFDYLSLKPRALGIMTGNNVYTGDLNLTFDAVSPQTQSINIKAQDAAWSIENPASWLKLSSTSGSESVTVTLEAEPNPSLESRVAVMNLVSKDSELPVTRHITVTQYGQTPYITPAVSEITMPGAAGSSEIAVETNLKEWTATTTNAWITATRDGNKVRVSVNENTGTERVGYVSVGQGETMATVKVTQFEGGVTPINTLDKYGVDGGSQTLSFNADASWTASTQSSWIDVKTASGNAGSNSIVVEVLRNTAKAERAGSLYIYIGSTQKLRVDVTQQGVEIAASPAQLDFESNGGKLTFQVMANTPWTLTPSASWIMAAPMQGNAGTTTVEVTVDDVGSTTPRSGKIDICQRDNASVMASVTVAQQQWAVGEITTLPDFPNTQSSQTVDIVTTGIWEATTYETWIHLSPTSGTGNGTLTVAVDENTSSHSRDGQVKVTVGSEEQYISVHQQGLYIDISCGDAVQVSTPCSVRVTVGSNTAWTASADVDWMQVTPASGNGNAELTVTLADNPSSSPRTGHVLVEGADISQSLSFTQPGKYLTLSHTAVTLSKNGGTSELVTVTTDGKYTVTASDTWFSVNLTETGFTVTATANNDNKRSGTVTVALSDLREGESLVKTVAIRQRGNDTSVDIDDWGSDEDWNEDSGETPPSNPDPSAVDKEVYGEDENWNPKKQ